MYPSSLKITSCEPAFAHISAHSRLIGFSRFFVNAQAESSTYPSTETLFCCPCNENTEAQRKIIADPAPMTFAILFTFPPVTPSLDPACPSACFARRQFGNIPQIGQRPA